MLLFWIVLLSLSAPAFVIIAPEIAMAAEVAAFDPVVIVQFLIVLFVAPAPKPKLDNQNTTGDIVFVLVMVKLLPPVFSPSKVTLSAPFNLINAPAESDPDIILAAPP